MYQQHVRYIQARGLKYNPVELFDHDLSKQIKEWRTQGERIVLLMDVNDHPLHNKFYTTLKEQTTNIEEFTHKCWGPKESYTHHLGKLPINGGYKSPEVEIVNLSMLNFAESPATTGPCCLISPHALSLANSGTKFVVLQAANWSHHRWIQ